MSCNGAAWRISSTDSSSSPIARAIMADVRPTRRVCSPVSSSLNSAATASRSRISCRASSRSSRPFLHTLLQCNAPSLKLEVEEPHLQQVLDSQEHLGLLERLRDEVLRPSLQRALSNLLAVVGGQHENRQPATLDPRGERLHDLETVRIRHVQVEQHEVEVVLPAQGGGLRRVRRRDHVGVSGARKNALQQGDVLLLIVDDQDARPCER